MYVNQGRPWLDWTRGVMAAEMLLLKSAAPACGSGAVADATDASAEGAHALSFPYSTGNSPVVVMKPALSAGLRGKAATQVPVVEDQKRGESHGVARIGSRAACASHHISSEWQVKTSASCHRCHGPESPL